VVARASNKGRATFPTRTEKRSFNRSHIARSLSLFLLRARNCWRFFVQPIRDKSARARFSSTRLTIEIDYYLDSQARKLIYFGKRAIDGQAGLWISLRVSAIISLAFVRRGSQVCQ